MLAGIAVILILLWTMGFFDVFAESYALIFQLVLVFALTAIAITWLYNRRFK